MEKSALEKQKEQIQAIRKILSADRGETLRKMSPEMRKLAHVKSKCIQEDKYKTIDFG